MEFVTPLSRTECLARLRNATGTSRWYSLEFPSLNEPQLVWVRGNQFIVMKAVGGPPRNSFRRLFHGEIYDDPRGALIRGRFRLHVVVRLFLCVWFGAVVAIGVLLIVMNIGRGLGVFLGQKTPGWWPTLIPGLMLSFSIVLVRSGISFSRSGEEQVIHYLKESLEALPIGTSSSSKRTV
jgi:hypothetical protein